VIGELSSKFFADRQSQTAPFGVGAIAANAILGAVGKGLEMIWLIDLGEWRLSQTSV
jgi:Zn-dependent alcohol dehydrogenase